MKYYKCDFCSEELDEETKRTYSHEFYQPKDLESKHPDFHKEHYDVCSNECVLRLVAIHLKQVYDI